MTSATRALTGPAAAALYGLDGFRDLAWPQHWCSPKGSRKQPGEVQSRMLCEPQWVAGVAIASPILVLRHLGLIAPSQRRQGDDVSWLDRVELAVEHALREGLIDSRDLLHKGGHVRTPELAEIAKSRRSEPPTESYAETRALQLFRSAGWDPWRQVSVLDHGRIVQRVDFVLPYRPVRRPDLLRPHHGLLIEIDGRLVHEPAFESDHRRQTNYDLLGFRWVSFSATQIEVESKKVLRTIENVFNQGPR